MHSWTNSMKLPRWLSRIPRRTARDRRKGQRNWSVLTSLTATETLEDRILLTGFTTDIDGDGEFTPLGDGVLAVRFMSGMTGNALVQGVVNPAGRRTDPAAIVDFLNTDEMQRFLDIDGDGEIDPATDGVLLLRGLAGFTGSVLTEGATDDEASRSVPAHVEFFINTASSIDDTAAAEEGILLSVSVQDGVLQNDPIGATIVGFDSTSELGATVTVSADGSYTYDPSTSDSLNQLSPSQSSVDSFTYTIDTSRGSQVATVEIAVAGRATGSEDLLTTNDNTIIGRRTSPTIPKNTPIQFYNVLDNDSGNGLRVVEYDETSAYGASVSIDEDGTFQYDPTNSQQLNALNNGNVLRDTIHYTTEDASGDKRQTVVSVDVVGVNDAPILEFFTVETTFGNGPVTFFPLDFASDIDNGDVLTVGSEPIIVKAERELPLSRRSGIATLNADGSVTYDPSSSTLHLAKVPAGESRIAFFQYQVADSSGKIANGAFGVEVTGARHAPIADPNDYHLINETVVPPFATSFSTFIAAEPLGLLSDDSDLDGDELVMVSVGDFTTQRGAIVTINADGSFNYDPHGSAELQALSAGQVVQDTFTYTINDSANDGEAQGTATVNVKGIDASRNPVVDLSGLADTSQGRAVIVVNLVEFGFLVKTTSVRLFDVVAGVEISSVDYKTQGFSTTILIDSLTIRGTNGNDIIVTDPNESVDGVFPLSLILLGGAGNDELTGGDGIDFIDGGAGNDSLFGGGGADVLRGGGGDDLFEFGEGDEIVDLNAGDQVEAQLSATLNQTPTPAQLQQTGVMTARLVDLGSFGEFVTVTGPSGYGFQLDGNWTAAPISGGGERFTTSSATLRTAVGDIDVGALTLNTEADSISNSGPLITSNNGLFSALALLTDNPIIDGINNLTGIAFDSTQLANQGLTFGLKLGSELMANELSGFGAPLNNAIPYLFASFNVGANLINFGGDDNVTVSSSINARVAFVFDPADPFFWLKGEVNGNIGGSIGFSSHGNIPFIPNQTPVIVPSNKQIYGNIVGSITLPVQNVFRLEGQLVLDYDRSYGPGNYRGSLDDQVSNTEFARLFNGTSLDLEAIVNTLANTELGINGSIAFTPGIGNTGLGVTLPIGSGTAMFYGGSTFAFKGATDDPFEKIPLLRTLGVNPGQIASEGHYNIETNDFRITARATQGNQNFGPFSTTGDMRFVLDNSGIDINFGMDTPVASVRFTGRAAFEDTTTSFDNSFGGTTRIIRKAGTFNLQARISPVDLDFVVVSVNASMTLTISNEKFTVTSNGNDLTYTFSPGDVQLRLQMGLFVRSVPLDVDLTADIKLTIGSGGSFNFSGTFRGTIAFGFGPVSAEFQVSNAGIRVEIPWLFIDTHIPIPGLLHVDQPANGDELLDHDLISAVALPGIIDESIRRLERTGLSQEEVALLKTVEFRVEDIDDRYQTVGYASGRFVTLDRNAAGHGWFVDTSLEDNVEFDPTTGQAHSTSAAAGRIDLLSAVMHEMTHILESADPGREFDFGEFGAELITIGQRFGVGVSTPLATRRD